MTPRTRNLYLPGAETPYKLSRSKIDLFMECPRCFYIDRRLGISRVDGPGFSLNSATDELLKKEFDRYREDGAPHPLMVEYGIDAIPYRHPEMDTWRENFQGVQYLHAPTNLTITGAVDDVWVSPDGSLHVVDYKSTSTSKEIDLNDGTPWKERYKRQMEVYQWLLRQNGFSVSDTGYFVYVNADKGEDGFNGKLVFAMQIIPHTGSDGWVEEAIVHAHSCLMEDSIPDACDDCKWCAYLKEVNNCFVK